MALKPSLVEWKPEIGVLSWSKWRPLKPSLVEWKLDLRLVGSSGRIALKPSLVEWKHPDVTRNPDPIAP